MNWQNVWAAIDARRVDLAWSKARMYRETGTSERTFQKMSEGVPIARDAKRVQVCRALGWTPDSIDRILDGGEPEMDSTEPVSQPDVADVLRRVELLEELVTELRETQAEEAERTAHSASAILDRLSTIEQRLTG